MRGKDRTKRGTHLVGGSTGSNAEEKGREKERREERGSVKAVDAEM